MSVRKSSTFAFLFMVAIRIIKIQAAYTWMEYELARFDNANGTLLITNLKAKRYDKTTFGISGNLNIVNDFSNDWEVEMLMFHSAKGNNQFVKMPYKVTKDNLCNIIDGIYLKSGTAKDVATASDLPAPKPDQSLCASYTKGEYTVRQYLIAKSTIPQFLQPGYYKAQVIFSKKNSDEVTEFVVHIKLY